MKLSILTCATLCFSCAFALSDELEINGTNISRDVTCNSNDIGVYGAQNTVHIKGKCKTLTVHGAGHKVVFEDAHTLDISGADNQVSEGAAANVTIAVTGNIVDISLNSTENNAKLDVSGDKNTAKVALKSRASIEMSGSNNLVEWTKPDNIPDPDTSIYGADNRVQKTMAK